MSHSLRWSEDELAAHQARRKGGGRADVPAKPPRVATARLKAPADPEKWPRELAFQLRATKRPDPVPEYRFAEQEGRRWRFDLAWPDRRFAVEVDGAVHRIKSRFKADLEKHQAAVLLGWRVFRVSPAQVRDGSACSLIGILLA